MRPRLAAIILAGSHTWQSNPFEVLCQRPLLPVVNLPLIAHGLRWLAAGGVKHAVICVNSGIVALHQRIGGGRPFGIDLHFYEDRVPRGPAGCVRDAAEIVPADEWVILDGNIIPGPALGAMLDEHAASGADVTVGVNQSAGTDERLVGENSPAGIYVFTRNAVAQVPVTGYQDIKERLIPGLTAIGRRVQAFVSAEPTPRVNSLDAYILAQEWLLERVLQGRVELSGYEISNGKCIHRSAVVAPNARLVGPVMVGPGSTIAEDVIIVGPTVIGAESRVDANAIVATSVLWDQVQVRRNARLKQCLVANRGVVQAGSLLHRAIVQSENGAARREASAALAMPADK
jgi:NDP-sugar pyrophosphorylase family protein